jgi:hypothetical protein
LTRARRVPHPLCGSKTGVLIRTLRRCAGRDSNWPRIVKISAVVAAGAPVRCYERLRWGRAVSAVDVRAPIFICGHWQSGHSLVHSLFDCDPQFATLRLRHAVHPSACLTMQPLLRRILRRRLPSRRIVDDLPNHLDAPQGDDLALGLLTGLSYYNAWYFPLTAADTFRDSVMMDGVAPSILAEWRRAYRRLLQKLLYESGRRTVVTRSAGNTARIPQLLAEFPDARFIYCHRNPYEVLTASLERWDRLTAAFSLCRRTLTLEDVETLTLDEYEQLLGRYLADRQLIPAGRLVEVGYVELQQRPVETVQRIYDAFGLERSSAIQERMARLPTEQVWELAGSRSLTPRQSAIVADRWGFAFREWGYAQ